MTLTATWHDVFADPVLALITMAVDILFQPLVLLITVAWLALAIIAICRYRLALKLVANANEQMQRERRDIGIIIAALAKREEK